MDSFELNKLVGAFLGVVFVIFSVSLISGAIFGSETPEKPGYAIEAQEEAGGGEATEEEEPQDIAPLLADADVSAGENIFKRCHACHTVEQGGANKVGPNLWGIVNRLPASHEGFSYSAGMNKFAEEVKHWDYDHLSHFLADPRGYVSGTAMSFAGLKDIQDRADVIAFLRQHAETPEPLPEPKAEPASDDGQAAEEGEDGEGEQAAPADEGGEAADEESQGADEGAAQDQSGASREQAPADSDEQAGSSGGNGADANQAPGGAEEGATGTENGASGEQAEQAAPAGESGEAPQEATSEDEGASGQAPANDNDEQAAPADEAPANDNAQPADEEQKPASGE